MCNFAFIRKRSAPLQSYHDLLLLIFNSGSRTLPILSSHFINGAMIRNRKRVIIQIYDINETEIHSLNSMKQI